MKRKLLLRALILIGYLSITYTTVRAQGWEKLYAPDMDMRINALYCLPDGNLLTTGASLNTEQQRIMKIKANGDVIWSRDIDSIIGVSYATITPDKGFAIIGSVVHNQVTNHQDRTIIRVDSNGHKLWRSNVTAFASPAGGGGYGNMGIDTTLNGGFIYVLNGVDSGTFNLNHTVQRVDGNGNLIWSHNYFGSDSSVDFYNVHPTADGGFIVNILGIRGPSSIFKIDSVGTFLWQYTAPFSPYANGQIAKDGSVLISGFYYLDTTQTAAQCFVGKVEQNGQQRWLQHYTLSSASLGWSSKLVEQANGNFDIVGGNLNGGSRDYYFFRVDSLGNTLYETVIPRNFLGTTLSNGGETMAKMQDGGYALGFFLLNNPQNYSAGIIKTDSNGRVFPHLLKGNLFLDNNNDCVRNGPDRYMTPSVLTFTNAADTFSVATRDTGYYAVGLNNGPYNLLITPSVHYTVPSACTPSQIVVQGIDTNVQLGMVASLSVPYVNVDGYTRQRNCFPNTYTAHYCNNGTAQFNGYMDITFDSLATVDSASVAWITPQTGYTYRFNINALGVMDCASIVVHYHLPCAPALNSRTLCINADVYSDSVINPSPLWDKSNLVMTGKCNTATDSVEFRLKNTGSGTTTSPDLQMIVIEDNVISVKHVPQLAAGAEFALAVKANGATWRATAQQSIGNPYSSFTTAAVEGCGVNQSGGVSKSFFNQYPNNGYYAFHYNTCTPVINGFDPNHKSVQPTGAGGDHLIDSTTELEYTIDFQNTGTDTAFFVRVVDTLASYLDISSIKAGISSHPYLMELGDDRTVTFSFFNILLPDSGANQVGSNGFVKFKIKQTHSNPIGTVINNDAAIYFDYNAPVITNTATVKIGKVLVSGIENLYTEKQVLINAYPNPFNAQTVITVDGENFDQLDLIVYDVTGKIVQHQLGENINQLVLTRKSLTSGSYLFELTTHGKIVGRGKLMVN